MRQIMKRVTLRYPASVFVAAALLGLASCQSANTDVQPVRTTQPDSTNVRLLDDGPPKQPSGPGCCH